MEIWSKCDICGRDIPVGELCYGLKKGNCICKNCCTGFENCTFTLAPMPTLTQPNEPRMINADKLAKRIAGHSNYHGDSILAAIYCAAEGKENDAPIRPIETPPNEWVSVDNKLPKNGVPVLIGNPHWDYPVVASCAGYGVWMDS